MTVTTAHIDEFNATARKLSGYRRKTIDWLAREQPILRYFAKRLRRETRGPKLARRLRRKAQLGRLGSF
ncbi:MULTISPECIES: hypothetical protein [Sphingomonas]|uniref:Uncharacterized protein n=1 Tax=Sphingomonas molluscorum TaxID=418184 RepID=A0ABU8Q7M6_9SPHN|nr:hypothetical protein [Sphingomonas sp. JUb134]MBM7407071.1 hypothetical protein [Sphingomonas sp. JUb134]